MERGGVLNGNSLKERKREKKGTVFRRLHIRLDQNFFLIKDIYLKNYKNIKIARKMHANFQFCLANFVRRAAKERSLS